MKKITRTALAIGIIFSSCQKQETEIVRNWHSPDGLENYCEDQRHLGESGTIKYLLEEGLTDAQIVERIKNRSNLPNHTIFLSTVAYGDVTGSVNNLDPEYIAFPLSFESMSNKWSHAYLEEYYADKQAFLDKYTDGKETGGMKYCNL